MAAFFFFFGHLTCQSPFQKQLLQQLPAGRRKKKVDRKMKISISVLFSSNKLEE